MKYFQITSVAAALCLFTLVCSQFNPEKFTFNVNTVGGSTYIVDSPNSSLLGVASTGTPSQPSFYDSLGAPSPIGINGLNNVGVSSALQTFAYISPTSKQRVIRIFYVTNTGAIRSLYHADPNFNPVFSLDSAVITTNAPLAGKFGASCLTDAEGNFVMVIQYQDRLGNLLQRWSKSDSLNSVWSNPVSVAPSSITITFPMLLTFNANTVGGSTYINNGQGTILGVASTGTPANPNNYDVLGAPSPIGAVGLTDVFQSTQLASFTYTSPTTQQRVIRIFYQNSAGELRSLYHADPDFNPVFTVDSAVIATNSLLGTTISASCLIDAQGNFVMVIQYYALDSTGRGELVQRWSTNDSLDSTWSTPVSFASASG